MSDPSTVTAPTARQRADLEAWRVLAHQRMPYFDALLYSLRVLDAPGLATFAVDQHLRLFVDFEWAREHLTDEQGAQVLLHEVGHVWGQHHMLAAELGLDVRVHGRIINIGADASINDDLRDAKLSLFEEPTAYITPAALGAHDYLTAHEYVLHLLAQGHGAGHGTGSDAGGRQDTSQGPGPAGYDGCGSGAGNEPAPCEPGTAADGPAGPGAQAVEVERVIIETAAAVREHAARARASVPAGIAQRADAVLSPPQVNWRQVLHRAAVHAVRRRPSGGLSDTSRRNRRAPVLRDQDGKVRGKIILPATCAPLVRIGFVRDTSASMGRDDLGQVNAEVVAIARTLRVSGTDLMVYDVDAAVHAAAPYQGAGGLDLVAGGGGTDMCEGIAAALAAKPPPDLIIVATDGYTPYPQHRPRRAQVIVVLVGDQESITGARKAYPPPAWAVVVEAPLDAAQR